MKNKITLKDMDRYGNFLCPMCNISISPDDYSDDTYKVNDVMIEDNGLMRLLITCKCGANIIVEVVTKK